jgi:hypothetical protein
MIQTLEIDAYRGLHRFKMTDIGRVNLVVGKNNSEKLPSWKRYTCLIPLEICRQFGRFVVAEALFRCLPSCSVRDDELLVAGVECPGKSIEKALREQ